MEIRKAFSRIIVILSLLSLGCTNHNEKAYKKPNVVFIFADDLGYGEIQALNPERGKIPTPHLNNLVSESMIFTDAHTSSSVCSPSRYSLLTGRYNWRTRLQEGVIQGGGEPLISPERMTLGNLFQNQGYSTAIVGKWHLDYHYEIPDELKEEQLNKKKKRFFANVPIGTKIPDGPITRGFNTFYGFHHSNSMRSIVRDDKIVKEIDVIDVLPSLTDEVVSLINQKAEDSKAGKPFFIYFPQNSPHTPIKPAKNWIGKTNFGEYGDFVAQTDASVGKVLEALERNGLSDNTIVIFSTDNGTSKAAGIPELNIKGHYPSGDFRGSKSDLWEGGNRVPLIIKWPTKIKAGSESDQLICLTDVMATFSELLDTSIPDIWAEDSKSFLGALIDEPIKNKRESIVHHSISGRFSIRQDNWKLLLAPGSGGWSEIDDIEATVLGLPNMQLYNLKDDIGEDQNLIKKYPEKAEALLVLLKKILEEGRSTPGPKLSNDTEIDIYKNDLNYLKKKIDLN